MNFDFCTEAATFIQRPNRYQIEARLHASNEVVSAHCPDPGRLKELLIPGAIVHLSEAAPTKTIRKTTYDLRFVEHPDPDETGFPFSASNRKQLISLDTRLPNKIFAAGLESKFFAPFREIESWRAEVTPVVDHTTPDHTPYEHIKRANGPKSRIDFNLLQKDNGVSWIEVKSATLVRNGCAIFPDAPTERGRRHVNELAHLVDPMGNVRCAVVFIVQRPDAERFRPNVETDPAFAEALCRARERGVELYAYTCDLSLTGVALKAEIPIDLTI